MTLAETPAARLLKGIAAARLAPLRRRPANSAALAWVAGGALTMCGRSVLGRART